MPKQKPHPFQIVVGQNPVMKCWEVQLHVGNFPDKGDAQQMADAMAEFMETQCNADVLRQQ